MADDMMMIDAFLGELLTSAVLVGTSSDPNINLINAKTLASSKVTLVTKDCCDYDCVQVRDKPQLWLEMH